MRTLVPLSIALFACSLLPPLAAVAADPVPVVRQAQAPDDGPGGADETRAAMVVETARVEGSIALDGVLDDPDWGRATVVSSLTQREPDEGEPASERTVVRVLYDDDALYVSARLYDSAPDSIVARLGRRDGRDLNSDLFGFFIDPYHDGRTGFYFGINAAGVLYDGVLLNDDWDDDSWDGVWQGRARIDEEGWVAELRIPYSQLRFHEREEHVWGINFLREIARRHERDYLVIQPSNESGFVSRFVDLVGIRRITPRRQVEIKPYVTTRAEYTQQDAGNPFNDGSRYVPDAGVDVTVGLTSNLTLNATVNPDFGQVEVDPAVVNLSDFETFFPEKRPFFIEGASVFEFGRGGATSNWGFNWSNPDFFYSRRIGRAPQGSTPDADYVDAPDGTRILGAAKLTGKLGDGLRVGTIQALTNRETADVLTPDGRELVADVEPLTYFNVTRLQREFNDGGQALGLLATNVVRRFDDPGLRDEINGQAHVVGLDGWTFLDADRRWVITGWGGLSHVRGTQDRILDLQTSSQHYFQRPDADHVRVDSSATALTGLAGRVMLNKQKGHVMLNAALGTVAPSFELNDVGFLSRTDQINAHVAGGYRFTEPAAFYRRLTLQVGTWRTYDYGRNLIGTGLWTGNSVEFMNYWDLWVNFAFIPERMSNRLTRGGPLTREPVGFEYGAEVSSDSRRRVVVGMGGFGYASASGRSTRFFQETAWKPASNVALSLQPRLELNQQEAQYVDVFDDPLAAATFGRRYVFAELDQVTFSSSIRLDWTFTPDLSFQLFAQPLISAGRFTDYKELRRPGSFDFLVYGEDGSTFDADAFEADPDGAGPADPLTLEDQDFNFRSLRGTAVVRWEFRPGSTLYAVWTQDRSDSVDYGDFRFRDSFDALLGADADNIFVVKLTYWFNP